MSQASLKFECLYSCFKCSFWKELSKNKLNKYKLDDQCVNIIGHIKNSKLILCAKSFDIEKYNNINTVMGQLKIVNTLEEFKSINKQLLIDSLGMELLKHPLNIRGKFYVLVYADLKHHKFIHWTAIPTFKTNSNVVFMEQQLHLTECYRLVQI